jgi:hypothetical protein
MSTSELSEVVENSENEVDQEKVLIKEISS